MMKRGRRVLIIGGVAVWILTLVVSDLQASRKDQIEKDITQKKKDLGDVKKEISVTRKREKEIRGKESSILGNLNSLETELYKKTKELKQMEGQLAQIRERLRQTRGQIAMLNIGLERTREELFSRLTALYKMGRTPPETILLTSQSFPDLLKIDKYFRVILHSDARLVETYQYQVALKERYQDELTRDQRQWERDISEVEKKKAEIQGIRKEKQALLRSIQNQKVVYQKLIKELEERAKNLQTLVRKLEREKSLLSYGKAKPENFKGRLTPPVNGKVISLFKERGQNGIEIQAAMGTEIRAVLPGKVLYADWFKGFGNIVIIDHGDHVFTVSGYCSELLKKAGEEVAQGEAIGLVGSAGSLKGPSLYFEIRHQGKPQDPMDWISQPDKLALLPEGNESRRK
ncbi:MAG: peptidoglycan DD-metalloendopeptidase family protein [Deltaproteobacteria bacterium]|jgi:septal ring factor EnvC (AmiA/AmiB activator)|nr:peptidoglycan DD-metalloendopeptidase family protein [Deltaproteobacteria bacterium]